VGFAMNMHHMPLEIISESFNTIILYLNYLDVRLVDMLAELVRPRQTPN